MITLAIPGLGILKFQCKQKKGENARRSLLIALLCCARSHRYTPLFPKLFFCARHLSNCGIMIAKLRKQRRGEKKGVKRAKMAIVKMDELSG